MGLSEQPSLALRNVDVEDLLGELLVGLLELIGEFLLQILFELATEALTAAIKDRKLSSPAVSAIGLAFLGAAAGLLSAWLFPHQMIAKRIVLPGVSLLLAPLATGSAMHFLGKRLRSFGRYPSNLATFSGGAIFAFSMALIRWCFVGLSH